MSAAPKHVRVIADPYARLVARFMCKVQKQPDDGCWIWTAGKDKDGYGTFQFRGIDGSESGRKERAHRIAYRLFSSGFAEVVLHKCDNPACVRPDHLVGGTHLDNIADRVAKGRSAQGATHGSHTITPALTAARHARRRRIEFRGKTLTLHEISEVTGVALVTLRSRIGCGWDVERAVSQPHRFAKREFSGTSVSVVILKATRGAA